MAMYSYDQVLTDVRQVYEQLTGLKAPKFDPKNPRFPLPEGIDPVNVVQSEINYLNLFLINSGISLRLSKIPTWTPHSEVYETPTEYVVEMDIAGVDPADVQVRAINNLLVVGGNRRFRRKSENAAYHSSDRVYGTFERLFPLPRYADAGNLRTSFTDGVLEVLVPKMQGTEGGSESRKQ